MHNGTLFIYKVLTQLIIILAKLRRKLKLQYVVRNDRTFITKEDLEESVCCDCGLSHLIQYDYNNEVTRWKPMRPDKYDYSFRRYAEKSSPHIDEPNV